MTEALIRRIEHLEQHRRRSRWTMVALASTALVATTIAAVDGPQDLVVRSLTVLDAQGQPGLQLSGANGPMLAMHGQDGALEVSLKATPKGGQLMLLSQDGKPLVRGGASVTGDGHIALGDRAGDTLARLGRWSADGPKLWFKPGPNTPSAPRPE